LVSVGRGRDARAKLALNASVPAVWEAASVSATDDFAIGVATELVIAVAVGAGSR